MNTHPASRRKLPRLAALFCLALPAAGLPSRTESALSDFFKSAPKEERTQPVAPEPQALELQDAFARVAAAVKPAVVSITAVHVESYEAAPEFFFGDPFQDFFQEFFGQQSPVRPRRVPEPRRLERKYEGMGSGVVVDPKGYILTNEHVVRGATQLTVTLTEPEEKRYSGEVVGTDPRTDLAVVKISPKGRLAAAALGDSDKVRVGDWALAVGSPFGLEQTVTVGIVSAVRQSLSIEGHNYANLLQTDASINRGNSGGPLVNIRGEVVGINTAIYAPTGVFAGVGFAIPANRAKEIMEQLIRKGRVVRGWMGVEVLPVDDVLARQFGLPDKEGVLVNGVMPGSPAEKAGLKRGDVIREFNGMKVSSQEALVDAVGRTPPKTAVKVRLIREGKPAELSLVTGEMPAEPGEKDSEEEPSGRESGEKRAVEWEGARFLTMDPALAKRYDLPAGTPGAFVAAVEPGGAAAKAGLMPGDLVASVNRVKTASAAAFLEAVKKADLKQGLLLDVNRRGRWIYLSYKEAE